MTEVWKLKTSDGEEYEFVTVSTPGIYNYDTRYHVLKGAYGHHGMEVKHTSDPVPGVAGEELRETNYEIREMYMPIRIQGTSPADFTENKQNLRRSLRPTTEAQLWITNEQGETRVLYCRYNSGFAEAADDDKRGPTFIHIPLRLIAHDPYFYDIPANEIIHETNFVASTAVFFDAYTFLSDDDSDPWGRIGSSSIGRIWTVNNPGDEDAYPVWTIIGPGRAPLLKNLTTGKSFYLNYVLSETETVVIDMRENQTASHTVESTVIFEGDTITANLRKYMDQVMRNFWALEPGANELAIEFNSGAEGAAVNFSLLPRFQGV